MIDKLLSDLERQDCSSIRSMLNIYSMTDDGNEAEAWRQQGMSSVAESISQLIKGSPKTLCSCCKFPPFCSLCVEVPSLDDVEAEEEDDPAEVAAEARLVGAANRDDGGLTGNIGVPDLHHLVARYPHLLSCSLWLSSTQGADGRNLARLPSIGVRRLGSSRSCLQQNQIEEAPARVDA